MSSAPETGTYTDGNYTQGVYTDAVQPGFAPEQPEAPKSGCGCGSCLILACALVVLGVVACGIGGWYVVKKTPDWARERLVTMVDGSDLSPEDKRVVTEQIDRVVTEYKAGNVTFEELGKIVEEFAQSPVLTLMMSKFALEAYIKPSGLSDEEKAEAELTLQRVARGVFEKKIAPEDLEAAMDHISTKQPDGSRQMKEQPSDEDLRKMLAECKRRADEAEVPNEPFEVNIGEEFKKSIDKVLNNGSVEQ